jgi:hypothetical protein
MRPLDVDSRSRWRIAALLAAAPSAWGCAGAQTKFIDSGDSATGSASACDVPPVAPPAGLGLSTFYTQYVNADGIPILASPKTAAAALGRACSIVVHMLAKRDDVRRAMIADAIRVTILARSEQTTDIPEYRDLNMAFPGTNWNMFRGVSATRARPVSSCGEENLLCLTGDLKQGEVVLVFTFGISMELGINGVDPSFDMRLAAAYGAAMSAGLWANTYSTTDKEDYWGEGMQSWFDAYKTTSPPDGVHNDVGTRAKLEAYDPTLATLLGAYVPDDGWHPTCP